MKNIFLVFLSFLIISCGVSAVSEKKFISEVEKFQNELNFQYRNEKESPLRGENFQKFTEHPFFEPDINYRIKAKFTRTPDAEPFPMQTSSGKEKKYVQFGKAEFTLDGKPLTLAVYQSLDLVKDPKYADYLFLPFRDATNGTETYGGGKYLDSKIPSGDEIVLDFNLSYQPYCAYNAYDYSCPIVPEENFLPVRIEAGVKYEDIWFGN